LPKKHKKKNSAERAVSKPALLRMPPAKPHIPQTARDKHAGLWFAAMTALQSRLRGPGGCPWDAEQTHASLRKFLIEESYEVLDAIESGDDEHFASELGDLLLQVIFHAILAEERGAFTISDVIEAVHTKMVRRHPHVFGAVDARDSKAVLKNWEAIKAEERAEKIAGKESRSQTGASEQSILEGVSRGLPALIEADSLTRKAARIRFDWERARDITAKIREELTELDELLPGGALPKVSERVEEEVGDLLFASVNLARFLDIDPEVSLKKANAKFKRRFQWMEATSEREGSPLADVSREHMEELWNRAKRIEHELHPIRPSGDSKRKRP
jgi:tetrapyrrole methylase family protein / MazG family protein